VTETRRTVARRTDRQTDRHLYSTGNSDSTGQFMCHQTLTLPSRKNFYWLVYVQNNVTEKQHNYGLNWNYTT
jgi:hypothetical protein